MYTDYFRLKESPFSIAPDPAYFFVSDQHREALAHLMYCFNSDGGFVLLTGEVGTGKTTVCRRLLQQAPTDCDIAFVLYPKLTGEELLAAICDDFGISVPAGGATARVLVGKIYDYLVRTHEAGRRAILIIEEAQNLSDDVLEQIRLLTNLETNRRKLLQIVMLGQPELRERLSKAELRQLSQRVTAQYHLAPLSRSDMEAYVAYRLRVAGVRQNGLFSRSALRQLYRLTKGVPRLINVICDRALMGAYIEGRNKVDRRILAAAAREVSVQLPGRWRAGSIRSTAVYAVLGIILVGAVYYGWTFVADRNVSSSRAAVQVGLSEVHRLSVDPSVAGVEPTVSLDSLLAARSGEGKPGRNRAFQAILRQWSAEGTVRPDEDVCYTAGRYGLACLEGKESLEGIRRLNRPAVLKMQDEGGTDYYVALTRLQGDRAHLVIGERSEVVDVGELARRWLCDYEMLWRLPPGYSVVQIRPGDKGAMASWLTRQMAVAEGRPTPPENEALYGWATADTLKRFQVGSGLVPDGTIGPKTIITLSDVTPNTDPHLEE